MHKIGIISCSLFVAFVLTLLPMPSWTAWLRPAWVLMVLIYWALAMPEVVGMGTAWVCGIIFDLLTGTLLGEHALALTIVIYLVSGMYFQIRTAPLPQQALSILVFTLVYQSIIFCVQGFIASLPSSHLFWLSSVTSMILWPWLFILLRDYRRRFLVAN